MQLHFVPPRISQQQPCFFQGGGFLSYSANFAFHEGHKPINSQYTWDLLPFKFTKKTGGSGLAMAAGVATPQQRVGGSAEAAPPLPSLDIVPGSVSVSGISSGKHQQNICVSTQLSVAVDCRLNIRSDPVSSVEQAPTSSFSSRQRSPPSSEASACSPASRSTARSPTSRGTT